MDGPSFDRRSALNGAGGLAGAGASGLHGTEPAAAEKRETSTGKTTPQFEAGEPEEFHIEIEMPFEDADGSRVGVL